MNLGIWKNIIENGENFMFMIILRKNHYLNHKNHYKTLTLYLDRSFQQYLEIEMFCI